LRDAQDRLVRFPHARGVAMESLEEAGAIRETHQAGQPLQGGGLLGQRVRLALLVHLKAVFDIAQEPVGLLQHGAALLRQDAVAGQLAEGDERLMGLQEGVPPAVKDLERLRHKLDLAYAAAPELDVAVHLAGADDLALDPPFHLGHLLEQALAEEPRIAEGMNDLEELPGQRRIARDAARLEEHHSLPRLAPFGVKVLVAVEGTGERARVALRAEAHVDAQPAALDTPPARLTDEGLAQALEELVVRQDLRGRLGRARRGSVRAPLSGVHDQEVHVGAVVPLDSAHLSHPEDGGGGAAPFPVRIQTPWRSETRG